MVQTRPLALGLDWEKPNKIQIIRNNFHTFFFFNFIHFPLKLFKINFVFYLIYVSTVKVFNSSKFKSNNPVKETYLHIYKCYSMPVWKMRANIIIDLFRSS
jgi:hypothetical protein